jgi:hypothetical protein
MYSWYCSLPYLTPGLTPRPMPLYKSIEAFLNEARGDTLHLLRVAPDASRTDALNLHCMNQKLIDNFPFNFWSARPVTSKCLNSIITKAEPSIKLMTASQTIAQADVVKRVDKGQRASLSIDVQTRTGLPTPR